jgi:GntR family carbon starvation induced transcriptional regulator
VALHGCFVDKTAGVNVLSANFVDKIAVWDGMSITEEDLTLANRVVEALRRDILTGVLEPGMKLRIEGLRERYGVGASPIREALSQMVAEKLVLRLDHRGFRVVGADLAELEELIQTELIISVASLRASIQRGDVEWEERLVLAHRRLELTPRSLDEHHYKPNPVWQQLHRAYHVALVDACGSEQAIAICGDVHDRQTRFRILYNRITQWPRRDVAGEHREITDAALAHETDLACKLLTEHLSRTADFLRETLKAEAKNTPSSPVR